MKSYKQRVVRIPVGVHKLPKVDFQQDISVRNNAASQISYQSYLIVDSQSNRLRNTESGIPYYLIIIVSCHLAKGLLAYLLCHIVEISVCKFGTVLLSSEEQDEKMGNKQQMRSIICFIL